MKPFGSIWYTRSQSIRSGRRYGRFQPVCVSAGALLLAAMVTAGESLSPLPDQPDMPSADPYSRLYEAPSEAGGPAILFGGGRGHPVVTAVVYEEPSPEKDRQTVIFSGYFEQSTEYSWYPDGTGPKWSGYERLRLKGDGEISGKARLKFQVEGRNLRGLEREPEFDPGVEPPGNITHFDDSTADVERMYVDVHQDNWAVAAGRQQIDWGQGWLFNPTNLFQNKDIYDADEEVEGSDGFRGKWALLGNSEVDVFLARDIGSKGGKGGIHYGAADYTGTKGFGLTAAYDDDRGLRIAGGDVVLKTAAGDFGFFVEGGAVSSRELPGPGIYPEIEAGVEVLLAGGWHVLVEYYHNGSGVEPGAYTGTMYYELTIGDRQSLGRDYAVSVIEKGGSGTFFFRLYTITNVADNGSLIVPEITYRPFPYSRYADISLKLGGTFVAGPPGSEYRPEYLRSSYSWFARNTVYVRFRAEF